MNLMQKAVKHLFLKYGERYLKFMNDESYIKLAYRIRMGRKLNLKNPQTFNEKLQWLKLHDRKEEYTAMVDKYEVRKYITDKIGEEYLIPLLGVWDSFDEIDFSKLPERFVLKCTHDSGGLVICKDKSMFDLDSAKEKINKCMKRNFYYHGREWPYKNVKPRIIAEEYMEDMENCGELTDYKVLCFNGKPKLIELHMGRFNNKHTQDIYDTNWNKTDISQDIVMSNITVEKPSQLDSMLYLSEILAEGIRHVRIDWYIINGKMYFGEITFFDGSGFEGFDDFNNDIKIGSYIDLSTD